MQEEIVDRAEHRPEERKQRADQSLDIAPAVTVVPESDPEYLHADEARYVFDQRHADRHPDKQQNPACAAVLQSPALTPCRQQIEDAQAASVKRQVGADAKTGIDPFVLRIGPGEKLAEEQLQYPTEHRADKEQISQHQSQIHKII